jgi:DNA-binding NarL/FixJ family response regulator
MRVAVVAESRLVRGTLHSLLAEHADIQLVGAGAEPADLTALVAEERPDVLLVAWERDSSLPEELTGPGGIGADLPVVVVTDLLNAARVRQALEAGVRGLLPAECHADELVAALRAADAGLLALHPAAVSGLLAAPPEPAPVAATEPAGERLSARELEVLALLADGLPNKAIARRLHISEHTVKFHIGSIMAKLGASSRTEAVTRAARRGLLML